MRCLCNVDSLISRLIPTCQRDFANLKFRTCFFKVSTEDFLNEQIKITKLQCNYALSAMECSLMSLEQK